MKKSNQPMIELYMYSLNQEFPVGKNHGTFLKRHSETKIGGANEITHITSVESQEYNVAPNDWRAQWISNRWITNHTKAAGVGIRPDIDPLLNSYVRGEEFGAILFEPLSDRVFKLNKAGHTLFNEITSRYKSGDTDLDKFKSENYSDKETKEFIKFLKDSSIWIV